MNIADFILPSKHKGRLIWLTPKKSSIVRKSKIICVATPNRHKPKVHIARLWDFVTRRMQNHTSEKLLIWIVREKELKQVHFDSRQYSFIIWDFGKAGGFDLVVIRFKACVQQGSERY